MRRWNNSLYIYAAIRTVVTVAIALLLSGIIAFVCSCTRTVYTPVERVRTEYRETDTSALYSHIRTLFDTVRQRETSSDSLVDRIRETVVLDENGDTTRHDNLRIVYRTSSREKELEHRVEEQDSTIGRLRMQLVSVKTDSIQIPYPVERQLTRWERLKMDFGGMAVMVVIAVLIMSVVWLIRKFRR